MAPNDRAGLIYSTIYDFFTIMTSVSIAEFSPTTSTTTTQAQAKIQNVSEALDDT